MARPIVPASVWRRTSRRRRRVRRRTESGEPVWASRLLRVLGFRHAGPRNRGNYRKSGSDDFDDAFHIEDATAPGAAADSLQRGPQACVGRQRRVRREPRMRITPLQNLRAFLWRETALALANQINAPFEFAPVDDDTNPIAVAHLANRPARQRFRTD